MMRSIVLLVFLGFASGLSGAAESVYTIKLKTTPSANTPILCQDSDKETGAVRFLNTEGKLIQEKKLDESSEEVYTLTVLEEGERAPKKFRQNYSKATSSLVKNNVRSYQGVNIEFRLEEGGYRLGLPPKHKVSEEDLEDLRTRANNDLEVALDQVFVPAKPVKVGDSWEVDSKLLRKAFAGYGIIDGELTKGTGRLTRVYDNKGVLFGVLTVNLTIAFNSMDRMKYDPPALFQVKGELDTDISGTNNIGTLTIQSTLEGAAAIKSKEADLIFEIKRQGTVKKVRSPAN